MTEHGSAPRALVVVNPAARGGAADLTAEVEQRCRAFGFEPVRLAPSGRADAISQVAETVRRGGWSAVLAVGGDGTARVVAEGLARGLGRFPGGGGAAPVEAVPALFVVPGGTGNSVYRALWEDRPWPEALDEAFGGRARRRDLDLLRIVETGEAVLLGASAGLLADAVRISEDLVGVSGRERYQAAAGAALAELAPFPGRVTVDGDPLVDGPLTLVAVGGARHRAGTFQLLPRSRLDDGLLDVCALRGVSADAFVELAAAVVTGEHLSHPEVLYRTGRSVTVERTDGEPLAFEHDGDLWPGDDRVLTLVVVPGAVPVHAPLAAVAG